MSQKSIAEFIRRYDALYDRAQRILDIWKPCLRKADGFPCLTGSFCCGGCSHLSKNGCTVRALSCKVWLCHEAYGLVKNARAYRALCHIRKKAYELMNEYGIYLGMRGSRDEMVRMVKHARSDKGEI